MSALPFFQWAEASTLGEMIRDSTWAFAVIESLHLLALSVVGGAVLLVDLRLLGLGLRAQPVSDLAREARPWLVGSLTAMLVTGVGLFLSEPMKCYASTAFAVKMTCLALAIVFTFTVRTNVTMADEGRVPSSWRRIVALASLALWFGVAASGRWIGFSS